MPANANCGLWRPIARVPAASVPAGGPPSTPLSDPSSAQQSDAVSMLMPLYDKRYRSKLRSHRVEQLLAERNVLTVNWGDAISSNKDGLSLLVHEQNLSKRVQIGNRGLAMRAAENLRSMPGNPKPAA